MNRTGSITAAFKGQLGRFTLNAEFTVPASGVTGLFGPSGCGKTTLLRAIAGLQRFADGSCTIDGEVWQDKALFRPAHTRAVGYVFQEASLFPHLSVTGNLLYATRGRRPVSPADAIGFDDAVALLGLSALIDRSPDHLSGGERQRVAIGRALLSQPKLLLMDEPLSALDAETKNEILPFLERLRDSLSLPIIYVSHDQREIERLAEHLVLMQSGRVRAAGRLSQLQSNPTLPLAGGQDAAVTLDAVVSAYDEAYGLATLSVQGGQLIAPMARAAIGSRQRLTIAASDVSLAREAAQATTVLNILPCRITSATPTGTNEVTVVLGLGPDGAGARLLAHITRRSWDQIGLAEGMTVYGQIKGIALLPSQYDPR
jgi:molybdate transport system ATP-binding protein